MEICGIRTGCVNGMDDSRQLSVKSAPAARPNQNRDSVLVRKQDPVIRTWNLLVGGPTVPHGLHAPAQCLSLP